MRQRLRRGGIDEAAIDAALVQLREHRLLDDAEFAQYWVEQRQTFRPRGARLLRAELSKLGVGRTIADEVTTTVQPTADEDAYRAAQRRAFQLRHLDRHAFEARLGAFLARRGFEWETVSSAVGRLWAELSTS